ncbi:hypothetical protein P3T24_002267 [Paraburkholderia sp. GAS33]|jgi:hypothetical protein
MSALRIHECFPPKNQEYISDFIAAIPLFLTIYCLVA